MMNKQSSSRYDEFDNYTNPLLGGLLNKIHENRQTHEVQDVKQIKQDRKMHHSTSMIESRRNQLEQRRLFNNKTKDGTLLDKNTKNIPYIFIPKYKNDTFIMPDRVFAKGKAGKRFNIKMKDTSVYSFRQPEGSAVTAAIRKDDKEKTIISRQIQEFNRIVDKEDGVKKAKHNTWYLKNRKQFNYAHTGSQLFSQYQPLLGQTQQQSVTRRKVSLAKTYNFSHGWRPNSRTSTPFDKHFSRSVYNQTPHCDSSLM